MLSESILKPVHDQTTLNVCSLSGLKLMKKERSRLTNVKAALSQNIIELERATEWDEVLSKGLLAANLIKATCDAFIEMAGGIGEAAGIKGTKAIATFYSVASPMAQTTTNMLTGQKVDTAGTLSALAKGAIATRKDGIAKDMLELTHIKSEIVVGAVQNDSVKVVKAGLLDYNIKLTTMVLDQVGKEKSSKIVGAFGDVISAGLTYSSALESAFNTRLDDMERAESIKDQKRQMKEMIRKAEVAIGQLDKTINECAVKLR